MCGVCGRKLLEADEATECCGVRLAPLGKLCPQCGVVGRPTTLSEELPTSAPPALLPALEVVWRWRNRIARDMNGTPLLSEVQVLLDRLGIQDATSRAMFEDLIYLDAAIDSEARADRMPKGKADTAPKAFGSGDGGGS